MRTKRRLIGVLVAVALSSAACGGDDGASVRETGAASGSGSASGSGAASGTASGTGNGTASGTGSDAASGTPECPVVGGVTGTVSSEVHANLTEFEIVLAEKSAKAGKVKLEGENMGKKAHEMAIIRTDDVSKLPLTDDGAVDDKAIGDALIGEIEPFASGAECDGTFELTAGKYAVICNIVEQAAGGAKEAHFKEGMHTTLTVTG